MSLSDLVLGDLQSVESSGAVIRPSGSPAVVPGAPIVAASSPAIGQPAPKDLSAESVAALFSSLARSISDVNATLVLINAGVSAIVAGQVGSNLGAVDVGLPTEDPEVAGALWNNSGVVNVSTGS